MTAKPKPKTVLKIDGLEFTLVGLKMTGKKVGYILKPAGNTKVVSEAGESFED